MSRIVSLRTIFFAVMMGVCLIGAHAQQQGFAVVVDSVSYREAKTEILDYIRAIEEMQRMRVYTVIDRWGIPDSIRAELKRLHSLRNAPIVGAVFVGDIPVPMIRDAQYLCSAFKMSQSRPWQESSVPSDRFYDDFGLDFRFLKRDSINSAYFYYSLTENGDQFLRPDIFSGRIRPTDWAPQPDSIGVGRYSRYYKLREYLRKATYRKRHPERLASVFVYTGSGSLSESKVAHIDEMASMREHFPVSTKANVATSNAGVTFSYMDYSDAPYIKAKLMSEMMRPDLSVGLMHHHGDYNTQYLSSYPRPQGRAEALEYLRHCFAQRIDYAYRFGENVDSVKQLLCESDGVPASWLDSLDEQTIHNQDSIESSKQNLTLPDFQRFAYRPNCRLAIYDACYNGSFHRDDCIANEYIFQPGNTIAGLGATVNVLQDKWPDRYLGLMSRGLMVGYMNMLNPDLEMHVVGDPTFFFLPDEANGADINKMLLTATPSDWQRVLDAASAPDMQALAVRRLADEGSLSPDMAKHLMQTSPYGVVRLEVYMALRRNGYSSDFVDALLLGANDGFELLQRFAVNDIIKCGDERLIPVFAQLLAQNNTSARVAFNAVQGIQFFPEQTLRTALQHVIDSLAPYVVEPEQYRQRLLSEADKYLGRWEEDILRLCADSMSQRRALLQADFMRIYLPPHLAARVAAYTENANNAELQVALLGALGWHRLGYQVNAVRTIVQRMADNPALSASVRAEAKRTLRRLMP